MCKAEPAVPAVTTDTSVAGYILDLREALLDCAARMKRVRDFYEGQ